MKNWANQGKDTIELFKACLVMADPKKENRDTAAAKAMARRAADVLPLDPESVRG